MEDRGRERTPVNLEELRRSDRALRDAPTDPGQQLRGQLTALAYDREGQQHAILDTGRERLAIPTHQNDLQVGQEYQAQSRAEREADRRRIAWQLDDLERLREHDHGLGR